MRPGITVVTPTIAPRAGQLMRARRSVLDAQTLPAAGMVVEVDAGREGAAVTRQRGLMRVDTEWVAFLDDDDELLPMHLEALSGHAEETGADYAFSWYEVVGGTDPRPDEFGLPWDDAAPRQTTVTTLVRTELAQAAGFIDPMDAPLDSPDRMYAGEDWYFTRRCLGLGARISHLPERTWLWHHHGGNTSGLPTRW